VKEQKVVGIEVYVCEGCASTSIIPV